MWLMKEFLFFLIGFVFGVSTFTIILFRIFFNKDAPKDTKIGNVSLYEEKLSNQIFNNVKVLCLVMTYPENHRTKAIYVKETWGKRCNKLFFMTSEHDQLLETVIVSHNESRDFLWDKTKKSFQYAHDNLLADFDWFLKADDDTYMVMENLRYMLSQYNEEDSLYFGHRYAVTSYMENGYMAGGGYVLSKAALKAFIKELADSDSNCSKSDLGVEDFEMGHCLNGIAIEVDCRDEKHGKRFFPIGVEPHMEREIDFNYWYFRRLHYNTTQGKLSCCSDTLAQMHYIYPEEMFKFEYFIYNVHPFGSIENISEILPRKLGMDEIVKASNVESFRHQFAKEIHDQAHQRRDRDRGEKNRSKSQTSSESSSQIDSLDQSLELIKNLNNQLD